MPAASPLPVAAERQGSLRDRAAPAATGAAGCNNPRLGQLIGATPVLAGGAYDFGAIALAVRPATVYVFSPTFGGCTQVTVQ